MTYINSVKQTPMDRNSANRQHTRLKAVLSKAVIEKSLHVNPYEGVKLKNTPTNRAFLTEEELQSLKNHSLGDNQSLKKIRDIFIFSVYTGLRYGDALSLKTIDIYLDSNGRFWIQKVQGKTIEMVRTPILKQAADIIRKYDNEERKITGYILPRISNQKLNTSLKVIADLVGIHKKLTHHIARHTFATTITLSNDIPMEIVSKMLGHTNIRTTQIYAKITNKYMGEIAEKLDKKFS